MAPGWLPSLVELLGEDVGGRRRLLVDHVGVDPERDRRIGVAEASRDDVNRDARQEERGGVDVAEVVEPGRRKRRFRSCVRLNVRRRRPYGLTAGRSGCAVSPGRSALAG
ncbi:hypothetical protein GCM10014719_25770 [Planomonospora parontospora subsp. antibiotica]|nr:hypothetical protein GCM10014719_25770 [Planomonospora parontospora subsp. antibiotica]GII14941.1 hypothetical protein Ppa05_16670 [Planomonospora parontospora subsp. antibiotica]